MDGINQLCAQLNKKYGGKVVGSAKSMAVPRRYLSTGSLALDIDLGGGIRVGRTTCFWGERSCGKTSTALRVVADGQKRCRNCYRYAKNIRVVPVEGSDGVERWQSVGECDCFREGLFLAHGPQPESKEGKRDFQNRLKMWEEQMTENSYGELAVCLIDSEDAFDEEWAMALGVEPRTLLLIQSALGEEAVDMVQHVIHSGLVDLMVVDSMAHFTPRVEFEKSAEEWQQALQARITNKGVRKFVSAAMLSRRQTNRPITQIWINQQRGVLQSSGKGNYGPKTQKPGGRGQEYAIHSEVKFKYARIEQSGESFSRKLVHEAGGAEKSTGEAVTREVPTQETFHYQITKSKVAPAKNKEGSYIQAMRDWGEHTAGQVIENAYFYQLVMTVLVKQTKKGYVLGESTYKTQAALRDAIEGDPELKDSLRSVLVETLTSWHA
jgi:RecA/RadA recombinase